MKVIDLFNKIANKEEVPKKIKVLFNVFEYDEDNYNYKNVDKTQDNLFRHLGHYKGTALNEKVEIIEDTPKEDKKLPKKIQSCGDNLYSEYIGQWLVHKENYSEYDELLMNKINEIIDYLKSKGE